ncbi:(2Fe-2S)-binding protein [Actinorhabdospora filicis]|uniref:(2Fe-2S)-binding protein n=1 Tax=Actinorhabdospora filicis TaxID=1785913 RepID=A0A9W6SHI4_9ACTN|nr:Rieske (2Fe-2S) protein [Actinorhabdospora filicis]GLZ75947.1 (2Fe-2S)-binding protein [Actinorhabdospora filicis]
MAHVLRQVTEDLILIAMGGRRVLAQADCPHRGGRLLFSHVNERTLRISCPLHLSSFDIVDGKVASGPACDPLRIHAVLPEEGELP